MNRVRATLTAGMATAISAAAIGAMATAQGVLGGGHDQQTNSASDAQVLPVAADSSSVGAGSQPQVLVRDLEPIVIQQRVASSSSSDAAQSAASAGRDASPSTSTPVPGAATPVPSAQSAAPEASPSVSGGTGSDDGPLHDVGDDHGGLTPRDDRSEDGDDRRSGDDDDRDDDDDRHGHDDDDDHGDDDDDD